VRPPCHRREAAFQGADAGGYAGPGGGAGRVGGGSAGRGRLGRGRGRLGKTPPTISHSSLPLAKAVRLPALTRPPRRSRGGTREEGGDDVGHVAPHSPHCESRVLSRRC